MTHRDGFPRFSASTRVARRCKASQAMRDAVRKPWETAVPVAQANRQGAPVGASESLDDVPHRLRHSSYPADRLRDLYGSLSTLLGIRAECARKATATGRRDWWNAGASHMHAAITNRLLAQWGLLSLLDRIPVRSRLS